GEIPAMFTVQRATEIMTALRLQQEFGFKLILDGGAESYLLIDEIKAAGVPVILHPSMVRNYGETKNVSLETAAALHKEGIQFALQSGYEGYVPKTRSEERRVGKEGRTQRKKYQAEDGIRDFHVTGVQTCALPIWCRILSFN